MQNQPRNRRSALGRTEELRRRESERISEGNTLPDRQQSVKPDSDFKAKKHPVLWVLLLLISLAGIAMALLIVMPQATGTAISGMPRIAFVDRDVVTYDHTLIDSLRKGREELRGMEQYFGPGIVIDEIDVSNMTMEQAAQAIEAVPATGGGQFSVTIDIQGDRYTINDQQVPMTRNTTEVLEDAWALGHEEPEAAAGETLLQARLRRLEEKRNQPTHFQTELTFDHESIRSITDGIAARYLIEPVDATIVGFDPVTLDFTISKDQAGQYLDADALFDAVDTALNSGDLFGTVYLSPETVFASMTTQELSARVGKISSFTTQTTNNKNRNINVRLSAEAINGDEVLPGATYSFNQATGQRSESRGYKPAAAISGGQNVEEIGGGVCQTSSTLFNAVARGNFEIVARSPHAWPSSYVEKGMDATVNWPSLDFVWRNNTDYPVYIVASYADRHVTVALYGVKLEDGVAIELDSIVTKTVKAPEGVKEVNNPELPHGTRQTTVKARKGYIVETWQVWLRDGIELSRNLLCTSTYRAYQETVEWN